MSDDTDDDATGAAADPASQIAALTTLISEARAKVRSGQTVDLAGLSGKVSAFCAGIAANPPADAESVARMIEAVVGDLNALARELAEQHARLTGGAPPDTGDGG